VRNRKYNLTSMHITWGSSKVFYKGRCMVTCVLSSTVSDYNTWTWIAYSVDVLKLTWICVPKYYMAWSISSPHACFSSIHRSLYPLTRGNLFILAKLPILSERDKNFFSNRVINIWNSLYLTILLRLDLSQGLNVSLTNLTFLTFYCINNFASTI